ncbi:MAG: NADH-quinone oxidoreductase subunit K [Phycisphaeraceae bacterium]|nr:NADH-quinone oxidoreductase subunit K [Phycisphaeraceae bacterium]
MELPLALVIGFLFACGTYAILRPNLIRVVLGFGMYSNAVNLLMIVCGGYAKSTAAPFVADAKQTAGLMDPLPPDIILTAIVISFAVGALFLIVCYRVYLDHGTDNPEELPQDDPAEEAGGIGFFGAGGYVAPSSGHEPGSHASPSTPHAMKAV